MHQRNPHRGQYDFSQLVKATPALKPFVHPNPRGIATIDFANPKAVMLLNRALLSAFYGLQYWSIPKGYLCPPIPGRADYIHHLSDLLESGPRKQGKPRILDIGTGANCIYPILGHLSYQWDFVASDISQDALRNAQTIISKNRLQGIELRKQDDKRAIFQGVIHTDEYFSATLCNPPFYASAAQAKQQNQIKQKNLNANKLNQQRNFAGQANELWCAGGELSFIKRMITESVQVKTQVAWFTCLVSRKDHLNPLKQQLKRAGASEFKIVNMTQGNKISRFLAWRF